ncbi:phenylacetaldoxime dehydratase family protein [Paracidovorax cattleyae]|uniref:phenylacetaldoxime dehydratase family protein n=2 Tax=Paracidovorax cattleyae TaxID=80868 RepID=UPI003EC143C8
MVARPQPDLQQVVMSYCGIQYQGEAQKPRALAVLREWVAAFGAEDGPLQHDLTHHVDAQGYDKPIAVGYWRDPAAHRRWMQAPAQVDWSFFRVAAGLSKLRLYHEVSVSDGPSQHFEYIQCHPATGIATASGPNGLSSDCRRPRPASQAISTRRARISGLLPRTPNCSSPS